MGDHLESGRLQSMEKRVCLKSNSGVPVAPEMAVQWSQARNCNSWHQNSLKRIMRPWKKVQHEPLLRLEIETTSLCHVSLPHCTQS